MTADRLRTPLADGRAKVERCGPRWMMLYMRRPALEIKSGDVWNLFFAQGQPEFLSPVPMRIPQGFTFPISS